LGSICETKATIIQKFDIFLVTTPFDISPIILSRDNPLGDFQLFARSSGLTSGFSFRYISSRASLRYYSSPAFVLFNSRGLS